MTLPKITDLPDGTPVIMAKIIHQSTVTTEQGTNKQTLVEITGSRELIAFGGIHGEAGKPVFIALVAES